MTSGPTIGVFALQGDVREHVAALTRLGAAAVTVRRPEELARCDGLVLPGGESTTMFKLARTFELFDPIVDRIRGGMPTFGTCAGMIMLADRVKDGTRDQETFGGLDVTVRRNAFGPQVDSTETELDTSYGPARVAFIRAPQVTETGPGVEVLARRGDGIVGVRQGTITGVAFHPELTDEPLFHRRLLSDALASR